MDPDLNKYNLHHRVTHHPKMSDEEWDEAYREAWRTYFTWEHMETVARRHARLPANRPKKAAQYLADFKLLYDIEGLHALEGGVFRRKRRRSRRPGLPVEAAWSFYPRHAFDSARKIARYLNGYRKARAIVRRVLADPARHEYDDLAVRPLAPEEYEALDLFHETAGGEAFVARKARHDAIIEAAQVQTAA
jgi:hypothetical protein